MNGGQLMLENLDEEMDMIMDEEQSQEYIKEEDSMVDVEEEKVNIN